MQRIQGLLLIFIVFLFACSTVKKTSSYSVSLAANPQTELLAAPDLAGAHIGFSVYDPTTKIFLYNYQGDKYFIPASNTKIITCYAAMKYLGDSLVGLRYVNKGNGTVEVEASGDPSFLHPDFRFQPVYDFLKKQNSILLTDQNWKAKSLGMGWAWDDYESDYMAERSMLPIYGNVVHFNKSKQPQPIPAFFNNVLSNATKITNGLYGIKRQLNANQFSTVPSKNVFAATDIPFFTGDNSLLANLLQDTLKTSVQLAHFTLERFPDVHLIHTQPTDSLLKIMMHRSDNFFAEQSLLMVSNQLLGEMSSPKIIDSLLNSDLKDLPQKPKWVDGSGLSRYNLFTPQDFVAVLLKMKTEFAWDRITTILASGGSGTLGNYYKNISGKIYAKTGSLSNNVALSGYLVTKSGKTLIFSVLVSNYMGSGPAIRKNVETFLTSIIENQ